MPHAEKSIHCPEAFGRERFGLPLLVRYPLHRSGVAIDLVAAEYP